MTVCVCVWVHGCVKLMNRHMEDNGFSYGLMRRLSAHVYISVSVAVKESGIKLHIP